MRKLGLAVFAASAAVMVAFGVRTTFADDMVDNPEFKTWEKCKVGTTVVVVMENEMPSMKMKSETTKKLIEITKEKAVVEDSMTMEMPGVPKQPPQVTKREVPAKVKKAEEGKKEGEKPKSGEKEIETPAGKFKCHWTETTSEAGGNKTVSTSYWSDDVPGGMVKLESNTEGASKSKMTMVVTKVDKK